MKALTIRYENGFYLSGEGFAPVMKKNGDYWRLHLDECVWGGNREIGVYSHAQKEPRVTQEGDTLTAVYDTVVDEKGTEHNIALTLCATVAEGKVHYSATIDNKSRVRVNELQYPLFQVEKLAGDLENDVLVMSRGLGQKVRNPHGDAMSKHTEYMAADYDGVLRMIEYPGEITMPFLGFETGDVYFYLGAHFNEWRKFCLITGCEARNSSDKYFLTGVATYPVVESGEKVCYEGFTAALFEKDWRKGVDYYRAWAESTWLKPLEKKDSVKQLQGWQRIIMKHQYGEIYHTYDDLPRLYEEGAKYGINMILLFAWWEEGMDAGYPNYRPDERMGGAAKLTAAIQKINEMGGRVILYANGHLIDLATDYYKTEGYKYTMKGIDGSEYQDFYKFSNSGTLLKFGHKAFAMGCFGTKEWPDKVREIEKRHLALGSNGTFFDQLGCAFHLCFDKTHSHGNRIDLDPELRWQVIMDMRKELGEDQWFGTEWPSDRISPMIDFTHGCGFAMQYTEDSYPHIFRYAFPEVTVTNRFLHDEQEDWEKHLNYAFVHGLIYDVALYRCRAKSIEECPNLAAYMKKLIDMRKEYLPFFTDGKYDVPALDMPEKVWGATFTLNGKTIQTVWNDSGRDYVLPHGEDKGAVVHHGEVKVLKV
ncbi:MAG: hypothetical protein E7326_06055 [Clostridiales bacterium]|nr:hypothetical protein [Clostridiales bacterium]